MWPRSPLAALVCCLLLQACGQPPAAPSAAPPAVPIRVLMMTATTGFRHDSIATARLVMTNLAASTGEFSVDLTEDVASFNAASLNTYDVIVFGMTTGELPFTDAQKAAIVSFIERGGGFIGTHSATDTLYTWPDYGRLVGAYFKEHPWTQEGSVVVEDTTHPSTTRLGSSFAIAEEFYTFRENPRPRVQVLLRLDGASVGASGDFPLAWTQSFGAGRAYYNALGHFSTTWNDVRFQQQILGAIRWAGERRVGVR
jgi:type 1 glutamine amidotransferase